MYKMIPTSYKIFYRLIKNGMISSKCWKKKSASQECSMHSPDMEEQILTRRDKLMGRAGAGGDLNEFTRPILQHAERSLK